jgi:hypothetical protein
LLPPRFHSAPGVEAATRCTGQNSCADNELAGAPEEIRTPDPQIRSLMDHRRGRSFPNPHQRRRLGLAKAPGGQGGWKKILKPPNPERGGGPNFTNHHNNLDGPKSPMKLGISSLLNHPGTAAILEIIHYVLVFIGLSISGSRRGPARSPRGPKAPSSYTSFQRALWAPSMDIGFLRGALGAFGEKPSIYRRRP